MQNLYSPGTHETTFAQKCQIPHWKESSKKFLLLLAFFVGLFQFSCGFLLNRSELPYHAKPVPNISYEAAYRRVIIILVDGLAFDFIQRESDTYPPSSDRRRQLSFVRQLVNTSQGRSFHFMADPPTTTLQRLKALTTGSMPTFIDVGSNFGSSALVEDNLISQWRVANKRILFVGDDTWLDLFPDGFHEAHPFPSFNVKDLDTVDQAVREVVLNSLQDASKSNWDILIGHMLGVDHCGHSHGPSHPEMGRKLLELDQFIRQVVNSMKSDDLLVVFGDHGMTRSGDHGGDSEAEMDAALLFYTHQVTHDRLVNHERNSAERGPSKRISQIDLVPTLASVTGVPVPYSSLGVCVPELVGSPERVRHALQANFVQMIQYTLTYRTEVGSFPLDKESAHLIASISSLNVTAIAAMSSRLNDSTIRATLHRIQTAFRAHWTRFDEARIWIGLLVMTSAVCLLFQTHWTSFPVHSILFLQLILTMLVQLVKMQNFVISLHVILTSILLLVVIHSSRPCGSTILHISILFALGLCHLSNSFVVHELNVTVALLQTSILWLLLRRSGFLSQRTNVIIPVLLMLVGVRLGLNVEICREESSPSSNCLTNTNPWMSQPLTKLTGEQVEWAGSGRVILSSGLLLLTLYAHHCCLQMWLHRTDCGQARVIVIQLVFPIGGIMLIACWMLDAVQGMGSDVLKSIVSITTLHWFRSWIARSLLVMLGLSVTQLSLMRFIHPERAISSNNNLKVTTPSVKSDDDESPRLISQRLHPSSKEASDLFQSQPVHCIPWFISTWIVIPTMAYMIFLDEIRLPWLFGIPLAMFVHARLLGSKGNDGASVGHVSNRLKSTCSWSVVVFVCLLDQASFYVTGHQTTLVGLPWDAAFAAYHGDHSSQWLPALMVLSHLYAGSVLVALSLPLYLLTVMSAKFCSQLPPGLNLQSDQLKSVLDVLSWRILSAKALMTLSCAISAALLRRHLMVWKIFAPRLFFSVASLILSGLALLMMRFGAVRTLSRVLCQQMLSRNQSNR